jgi:hypothetical protein
MVGKICQCTGVFYGGITEYILGRLHNRDRKDHLLILLSIELR